MKSHIESHGRSFGKKTQEEFVLSQLKEETQNSTFHSFDPLMNDPYLNHYSKLYLCVYISTTIQYFNILMAPEVPLFNVVP